MTYKGKVYGLPYYADTISFIYNKKILADAGIAVPTTWEEVTAAAEKLKAGGMEHPIVYEYNQELPNFYDAFVAQAYGRGAELFDTELNPLFADPEQRRLQAAAVAGGRLLEGARAVRRRTNSKIIPAMNTGNARLHHRLHLRARRAEQRGRPAARRRSSRWRRCRATTHATLGFAKSYVVTAKAAADPARAEAAWKFVNFMAGKPYTVAKRWAVEKGLGFGQLPLFEDQDVIAAWGKWVDVEALGEQAAIAKAGT